MASSEVDVAAVAPSSDTATHGGPPAGDAPRFTNPWALVALTVACIIPFVVALVALAHPTWYPTLDLAHTDLRVRDVLSSEPPLVGLPGRIGSTAQQGSHPGPLSFWALAPLHRLYGASTWALQAATATLNVIAVFLALWMAWRRGGRPVLAGVGASLTVLLAFYGPDILMEAWNPYLPVIWWFVFLVAVWSVWCEDFAMLPVLVFAACFCLQTHISYAGLAGGLCALTAVWLAWSLRRRWADRDARRRLLAWIGWSVGLGAVLWLPPVIQQLTGEHGNLTILYEHFTDPPEEAVGLGTGARVLLVHLNPWRLVSQQDAMQGAVLPGALFAVAWGVSAAAAWRFRARALVRLDLLLGITLVLALISASRIFGFLWYYLVLWAWGITVLMLLAVGWSVALAISRLSSDRARSTGAAVGWGAVVIVTVVALGSFTVASADAEPPDVGRSEMLRRIVPATEQGLDAAGVPGGGRDGRYLVTWTDPYNLGGAGFGFFAALDRAGFRVGVGPTFATSLRGDRTFARADATGEIHLAVGAAAIAEWKAKPLAREIARSGQSAGDRAEYEGLRRGVIAELRRAGLADLVPTVDDNLFIVALEPRAPEAVRRAIARMVEIDQPASVFVQSTDRV